MICVRSGRLIRSLIAIFGLPALTTLACADGPHTLKSHGEGQTAVGARRLRPPDSVQCPRDRLTSFTGSVLSFHRSAGRVVITVRTDEDTSENFVLSHPTSEDPAKWFLMRGKPFERSDWEQIESAENRLRPKMRATIWVCDDGTSPIVDWLPPSIIQRSPRK